MMKIILLLIFWFSCISGFLVAHQPVMDMAPRWEGGYGVQTRLEYQDKSRLVENGSEIVNLSGLKDESTTLWLEGVYSFTKEHRISFKLPWIQRNITTATGSFSKNGVGDMIIGFINKAYINKKGWTANVSLTPSFKIPIGHSDGAVVLGSGVVDYGLSVSGSYESFNFYSLFDAFGWVYPERGDGTLPGNMAGFDWDLGIHPYHNNLDNTGIFLMMGVNGRHYSQGRLVNGTVNLNSGGQTLEIVPTFVWYKNNIMTRFQYHMPVYWNLHGTQLAPNTGFQMGIGIAFES
ncbi:MAG: hypothetical protein HRT90_08650 [Candidatus Margulisbacteria bacterium]|nr:hypothetical protein [Candidatus Margulisiibacteriota bacterium]